jgi:hypothetical protein
VSNVTKVEDSKVQSPVAVGSSSPSGGAVSSRKRPVERTVTRVPRKIVRSDSMSVPTHLDPRALSQGLLCLHCWLFLFGLCLSANLACNYCSMFAESGYQLLV